MGYLRWGAKCEIDFMMVVFCFCFFVVVFFVLFFGVFLLGTALNLVFYLHVMIENS